MKTLARPRDKAEILGRLATLRPDHTARWGRMSAHQMVCHLTDAARMMMGAKPVSDATGLLQRTLIKWIALYAPVRWPPGIMTRPEIDQSLAGTRPGRFDADVAELATLVERIAGSRVFHRRRHPIFGSLSARAWLRWAYLHMDHHLRQFGV
jgi:hypothetical protein